MKLRFEIDHAEAFRRGIDAPSSTATVEVDPAQLTPDVRQKLAGRLRGIEVCQREQVLRASDKRIPMGPGGTRAVMEPTGESTLSYRMIVAYAPTFDALLEAVHANEKALATA